MDYLMLQSNRPETLEEYIDLALLLSGSSLTVGIADENPSNPSVLARLKPRHVMAAMVEPPAIMEYIACGFRAWSSIEHLYHDRASKSCGLKSSSL